MNRKHSNKVVKLIAVLVLLLVASSAFAGSTSDTTVLRLRGYVAPTASFSASVDGQVSVQANTDGFHVAVLDQDGNDVLDGTHVAAQAGRMTFSVMAV